MQEKKAPYYCTIKSNLRPLGFVWLLVATQRGCESISFWYIEKKSDTDFQNYHGFF